MKYIIGDVFRLRINGEIARWVVIEINKNKNQYKLRKISNEYKIITLDADIDYFDRMVFKKFSHVKIAGCVIEKKEYPEQEVISGFLK